MFAYDRAPWDFNAKKKNEHIWHSLGNINFATLQYKMKLRSVM